MIAQEAILEQFTKKIDIPIDALYSANLSIRLLKLPKGELFVQSGEQTDSVALVVSGILRKFAITNHGVEVTTDIVFADGLAAPYADQLNNRPSQVSIEVLEAATLAVFSFAELRELVMNDPVFTTAGLKITENLFLEKSEREYVLLSMSARERFEYFIKSHPTKWKKIPKNIIASFLGINPSTLSRIKFT